MVSSVVATGRAMAGAETFITDRCSLFAVRASPDHRSSTLAKSEWRIANGDLVPNRLRRLGRAQIAQRLGQAVEPQINHRRRVQRQHLTEQQAADNRYAQRTPQLGACA